MMYNDPRLAIKLKLFQGCSILCLNYYNFIFSQTFTTIIYRVNILSKALINTFFLHNFFECLIPTLGSPCSVLHSLSHFVFSFQVILTPSPCRASQDSWGADSNFSLPSNAVLHCLVVTFSVRDLWTDTTAILDLEMFSIQTWEVASLSSFMFFL